MMVVVTHTGVPHTSTRRGGEGQGGGTCGEEEKNIWMEIENGKVEKNEKRYPLCVCLCMYVCMCVYPEHYQDHKIQIIQEEKKKTDQRG